MIDFLTALLEPQSAKTPVLKPRLPALFEPLAPRIEVGFAEDAFESETEQPPRASIQTAMPSSETAPPLAPIRERAPYRGVMNPSPLPRAVSFIESVTPPNDTVLRASETSAKSPEPSHFADDGANPRATQTLEIPSQAQAYTASAVMPSLRPAPFAEPPTSGIRGESDSQNLAAPEPAPIVRVTIGRIVVRAVSPAPAAPAKRQTPTKKLSLDDYLSKGKRGER